RSGGTGASSGSPGQASGPTGPGTGASGSTGSSGGSGSTGTDLLSLFSEVLQLISSGLPSLVQLGNQLIAQLGPGLQALAKAVENGSMTVKDAIAAAAEQIGEDIGELELALLPPGATGPIPVLEPMIRALLPEGDRGAGEPVFTTAQLRTEVEPTSSVPLGRQVTVEEQR
ncbi:hypothetical protein ACWGMO_37060, partial [Nocardia salmonicida]